MTPSGVLCPPSCGNGRLVRLARKNTLSLLTPEVSNAGSTPATLMMKRDSTRVSSRKRPSEAPTTLPRLSATRKVSSCLSEYAPMTPRTCTSGWDSLSGMMSVTAGSVRCDERAVSLEVVARHHDGREAFLEDGPHALAFQGGDPVDRGDGLVLGAHDETGHAHVDDLAHRSAIPCDHRRAGGHRLDHHQPERLGPVDGKQQGPRAAEQVALGAVVDLTDELDVLGAREQRLDLAMEVCSIGRIDLCRDAQRQTRARGDAQRPIDALLR